MAVIYVIFKPFFWQRVKVGSMTCFSEMKGGKCAPFADLSITDDSFKILLKITSLFILGIACKLNKPFLYLKQSRGS